jgi:hypothetical protein
MSTKLAIICLVLIWYVTLRHSVMVCGLIYYALLPWVLG